MTNARRAKIVRLVDHARQELDTKRTLLANATRAELAAIEEELRCAATLRQAAELARERLAVRSEAVEWTREAVWQAHLGTMHCEATSASESASESVVEARQALRDCLRRAEMFDALLLRLDRAALADSVRRERRADDERAARLASLNRFGRSQ